MTRIRSIKPEFWSSPGLPKDPWARLLFVAMWNWADDNGVGTSNPRELLGFAFPNDEDLTVVDLRRMLVDIQGAFGVKFYEVAGRPYYSIPSWEEHQKFDRRSKGKHPTHEEAESLIKWMKTDDSGESPEFPPSTRSDSVAGTGEQGNRGTGEQYSLSADESADDGTLIPSDWMPTQKHLDLARSLKQDIDHQAKRFQDHAVLKQRRQKNWHAAFTNWLKQGAVMAQQRTGLPSHQTFAQQKTANALALVNSYQEEEHAQIGDSQATYLRALDSGG